MSPSLAGPRRRRPGVLAAALALYFGLALAASRTKSSTFDEPIHLPPGYISLTLGDHRLNPDHPPLVRRLAALPLLLLDVKWDRSDLAWRVGRPWELGKRFLYRWNDAERPPFWGRLPILEDPRHVQLAPDALQGVVLALEERTRCGPPREAPAPGPVRSRMEAVVAPELLLCLFEPSGPHQGARHAPFAARISC